MKLRSVGNTIDRAPIDLGGTREGLPGKRHLPQTNAAAWLACQGRSTGTDHLDRGAYDGRTYRSSTRQSADDCGRNIAAASTATRSNRTSGRYTKNQILHIKPHDCLHINTLKR